MTRHPSRKKKIFAISGIFLVLALLLLHLRFPLPYVYTVMTDQGPDYDDMYQFPARRLAPAGEPASLQVALDARVAGAVARHPAVESLDDLLDDTETSAFLVLHRGVLIEEQYRLGNDRQSFQNSFSVAKSVLSAMIGKALEDGALALDAPISRYLPELGDRDARFAEITIKHLLDMRSGIYYSRAIRFPIVNQPDPLVYYFPDLEKLVLERSEIQQAPGEFLYNNYNPPLLGLALRRATGLPPAGFLEREIWQPMGATGPAGWSTDEQGFERMESGFFATARDLARFGQLYLDGGMAAGRRVLPESWVAQSTELTERPELDEYDGRRWSYRLGWWIVPRPEGRSDFTAIGHFGQFVYVSPQYRTVIVRTGPGRGAWGDRDWTGLFYALAKQL